MKLLRLVVSDLHLGTGQRRGELNPFEDFSHDDRFAEFLAHHDRVIGEDGEIELILNGDIFDLLEVAIGGTWPTEITEQIATEKLRLCLDGHPRFVRALSRFMAHAGRRIVYLPGNHDLDMWFPAAQDLFRRYVAPPDAQDRVRFITSTDTYYLPEGIQIRHGHQFERIHRVDYSRMTYTRRDGTQALDLPWGSLWILQVLNRAKAERNYIDRIRPFRRFLFFAFLMDTGFAIRFSLQSVVHFIRHRLFTVRAWRQRIRNIPRALREDVIAIGSFDDAAWRVLRAMRGVHTLIVGHSHAARYRSYPGGKILVNTGTWTRMLNISVDAFDHPYRLTYAAIEYDEDGKPQTNLMQWNGSTPLFETIPYAD